MVEEKNANVIEEYFKTLKEMKKTITEEGLKETWDNAAILAAKYQKAGQVRAFDKLMFKLRCLEKEAKLIQMGIDQFVYKDDIVDYSRNITHNAVCIIDLVDYEREIPDEIMETVAKVKDIFDHMYVIYTDYTGDESSRLAAELKAKDPILFGSFGQKYNGTVLERWYFLGDWIDEYCDLTFDKMIEEFAKERKYTMNYTMEIPKTFDELKKSLDDLKDISTPPEGPVNSPTTFNLYSNLSNTSSNFIPGTPMFVQVRAEDTKPAKKSFFDKVRSVLK